jgi:uncharacterized protein (TIGR03067 family)
MFTRNLIGAVLVFSAFGLLEGRADAPRDGEEFKATSLASLEGTWVKISVVHNGATNEGDGQWVFLGGYMTSTSGDNTAEGRIQATPGKEQGEIDFIPDGEGEKLSKGIFKIEGDTLTVCHDGLGKGTRPTEFDAKRGSDRVLTKLKKVRD